MQRRKYSSKKMKKFMITGMVVWLLLMSGNIILVICIPKHTLLDILMILSELVIGIIYFFWFYRDIYLPNLRLTWQIKELNHGQMKDDDMIQEIVSIISSLDSIALKEKNAEILEKNAEINNLQDQINPHFLYNTLEVIRGEALLNGEEKIAGMTLSLANYFRYNISRKETFVYLKDELKNGMNYFNIQKTRFGDKISCEIIYHDIEESLVSNCYIPKLILQPVIENAIYHGLEMKMGAGKITIHITATKSSLKINVADDGMGMTQEKVDEFNCDLDDRNEDNLSRENTKRHNGVAVKNIRKRLKLYWEEKAYMVVVSELGVGTQVHISMPLIYQIEEYMN